jgi:hypothetical protein
MTERLRERVTTKPGTRVQGAGNPGADFEDILDGSTLTGREPRNAASEAARIEDGAIHLLRRGWRALTSTGTGATSDYRNFELDFKARLTEDTITLQCINGTALFKDIRIRELP